MERSNCVRVLLGVFLAGSLTTLGCKKDEEPATVPVPATTAAATTAPAATATAAATDAPSGAPAATDAPTAPPQPVATNTQTTTKHETIDACCSALAAIQKSGKTATAKSKAAAAAAVCPGIAKLVKAGTTSRTAGLAQIRSAMTGFDVPGECK